jgi:hypothetical protein
MSCVTYIRHIYSTVHIKLLYNQQHWTCQLSDLLINTYNETQPVILLISTMYFLYQIVFDVIYEQRERVFGYPGETQARVVYMASQMNRDVTECFRLLI